MNKFGAIKTAYKGVTYDSKLEAHYAVWLEGLLKAKKIKKVERQYKIEIVVNDKKICTHNVDFLITLNDNRKKFFEVKGKPTAVWNLKKKLVLALFPNIPYLVNAQEKELCG